VTRPIPEKGAKKGFSVSDLLDQTRDKQGTNNIEKCSITYTAYAPKRLLHQHCPKTDPKPTPHNKAGVWKNLCFTGFRFIAFRGTNMQTKNSLPLQR
jgi:hypothetical protein